MNTQYFKMLVSNFFDKNIYFGQLGLISFPRIFFGNSRNGLNGLKRLQSVHYENQNACLFVTICFVHTYL